MAGCGYRRPAVGWWVLLAVSVAAGLALIGPASAARASVLPVPPVPPRAPQPPLAGTCQAACSSALPVPARPEAPEPPVAPRPVTGSTATADGQMLALGSPLLVGARAGLGAGARQAGSSPGCSTCGALVASPDIGSAPVPVPSGIGGPIPPLPALADTGTPLSAFLAGLLLLLTGIALWVRQLPTCLR
jgi:hypothetical protein